LSTQENTTASWRFTIASLDWCLPSRVLRNEPDLAAAAPGSRLNARAFDDQLSSNSGHEDVLICYIVVFGQAKQATGHQFTSKLSHSLKAV
jgi:hypothetical protein